MENWNFLLLFWVFCFCFFVDFYFVWCTLYSLTVVQCVLYPKWLAIYSNILTSHHWVRGWITLQETSSSSSAQWCSSVSITICKHCHRYTTTDIIPHIIGKPSRNKFLPVFPKGMASSSTHHLDLDFYPLSLWVNIHCIIFLYKTFNFF